MTKELLKRIERVRGYEATKKVWRKDYSSKEFKEASALNLELFGDRLEKKPGCECVEIFFFNLNWKYKQVNHNTMTAEKERAFVLKKGKMVSNHHFAEPITQHSPESDLIMLLKINPKAADKFERLPTNWEKIVADFDPKAEKEKAKAATKEPAAPKTNAPALKLIDDMNGKELDAHAKSMEVGPLKSKTVAEKRDELKALISATAPKAADNDDDEAKAEARYAKRKAALIADGWDDSDDVKFVKGDHTIDKGEVWVTTDDEFKALLPTA